MKNSLQSKRLDVLNLLNYRWLLLGAHVICFALAAILAFLLRFEFQIPSRYVPALLAGIAVWVPLKSLTFHIFALNRGWWRYVSIHDLVRLAAANLIASVFSAAILWSTQEGFPRSIYVLDMILCFGLTAGVRMVTRFAYESGRANTASGNSRRLFIYGAGDAGVALLREIRQNPELPYRPVGFIDDDPEKHGIDILGLRVLGNGEDLPTLAKQHDVHTVLVALPSSTGQQMTRILQLCHQAGVHYKTIPGMAEVIEGRALAGQIRDVAVEDLLGRDAVRLDNARIEEQYRGKIVLVTGAGGSIGSELCRQLARFGPAGIVGYEIAETPLFLLERELRQKAPSVPFYPVIGCIRDIERLNEVFEQHRPTAVYHAAAFKHVPMMEAHPIAAIQNNVFGTYNVAAAAASFGAEKFVMISTDKAVHPTSIMGVSKRVAELVVNSIGGSRKLGQDLSRPAVGRTPDLLHPGSLEPAIGHATEFVSVRFGNVLGSNGSVIPLFKAQIAAGGPVQVTHPEMRRYFMTIPEACQLVLQASTMGNGNEIFVLDMGNPVKIVDLARNLILLSGLEPDKDIQIEFTGIRPGEKLYEEVNTAGEEHLPTGHEKIRIFSSAQAQSSVTAAYLNQLQEICLSRDVAELVLTLKEIVPDYNPSAELLKQSLAAYSEMGIASVGYHSETKTR